MRGPPLGSSSDSALALRASRHAPPARVSRAGDVSRGAGGGAEAGGAGRGRGALRPRGGTPAPERRRPERDAHRRAAGRGDGPRRPGPPPCDAGVSRAAPHRGRLAAQWLPTAAADLARKLENVTLELVTTRGRSGEIDFEVTGTGRRRRRGNHPGRWGRSPRHSTGPRPTSSTTADLRVRTRSSGIGWSCSPGRRRVPPRAAGWLARFAGAPGWPSGPTACRCSSPRSTRGWAWASCPVARRSSRPSWSGSRSCRSCHPGRSGSPSGARGLVPAGEAGGADPRADPRSGAPGAGNATDDRARCDGIFRRRSAWNDVTSCSPPARSPSPACRRPRPTPDPLPESLRVWWSSGAPASRSARNARRTACSSSPRATPPSPRARSLWR